MQHCCIAGDKAHHNRSCDPDERTCDPARSVSDAKVANPTRDAGSRAEGRAEVLPKVRTGNEIFSLRRHALIVAPEHRENE